jgi:hypothetical protein
MAPGSVRLESEFVSCTGAPGQHQGEDATRDFLCSSSKREKWASKAVQRSLA